MEGEGIPATKRAEIDTRAPFTSVKEAVSLFGEKVLVTEVYANKLKEVQKYNDPSENENGGSKLGTFASELKEAKHDLQRAREESGIMANCLSSLKEELERTKQELQHLKQRDFEKQLSEFEINEDIKIVEDSTKFEVKEKQTSEGTEFQKKRYVTFANPPSLAQVIVPQAQGAQRLERHPPLRKKKKKPLIPLIGGIFSKKKVSRDIA